MAASETVKYKISPEFINVLPSTHPAVLCLSQLSNHNWVGTVELDNHGNVITLLNDTSSFSLPKLIIGKNSFPMVMLTEQEAKLCLIEVTTTEPEVTSESLVISIVDEVFSGRIDNFNLSVLLKLTTDELKKLLTQYQSKNALIGQTIQQLAAYTSQLNNIDNEISKLIEQRTPLLEKMELLAKDEYKHRQERNTYASQWGFKL